MQRFRGGLVFRAHRLCVSLNSRLESNKEEGLGFKFWGSGCYSDVPQARVDLFGARDQNVVDSVLDCVRLVSTRFRLGYAWERTSE